MDLQEVGGGGLWRLDGIGSKYGQVARTCGYSEGL
jgi:hypothetical protein